MRLLVCPFCEKEVEKFHPKSHIVPEWMYVELYDERHKALMIELKGTTVRKIQKGLYRTFICSDCEMQFADDDRYASLALGGRNKEAPEFKSVTRRPYDPNVREFTVVEGLNFKRLQKFVFGVILRGTLAPDLTGDKRLLVGKHFDLMRSLYFNNDKLDDLTYPIMIEESYAEDPYQKVIFLPFHTKIDNQHAVRFSGAGFTFTVMVSSHEVSENVGLIRLMQTGNIILIHGNLRDTGTFKSSIPAFRKISEKYGKIELGKRINPLTRPSKKT